jgi:hypothetical protein
MPYIWDRTGFEHTVYYGKDEDNFMPEVESRGLNAKK